MSNFKKTNNIESDKNTAEIRDLAKFLWIFLFYFINLIIMVITDGMVV